MPRTPFALSLIAFTASAMLFAGQAPPSGQQPPSPPPQQPSEVALSITGEPGTPPRFAVPDFVALTTDAETVAAAKTITQVLWNDLQFEQEFYLIPRDTYASIPAAATADRLPFDRWRELGADGVVFGTVKKTGDAIQIEVRLFNVRSHQAVFGKEYSGSAANPRVYAHTVSDEVHQQQRALRGVARTKLTFASDRDGEKVVGSTLDRNVKEIYIADYDGANQRRVTVQRGLNITPTWSPDGRSIAYTSYRRGFPDLFISLIYQGMLEQPTGGKANNYLPAWSPDGTKLCFMSNRDGNPELYVMDRDGSNVRRLTNNPAADTSPTWSPSGNQIAFTSDRTGTPQIYVVGLDGLNARKITSDRYSDRPTWSPAPYNEIAYSSQTGPGNDIKVLDLASGEVRQLTFGEGSNESPSWAPNGRHVAFMSTRSGKSQIFTIGRDGKNPRRVTENGNNYQPDWSR